MSHEFIKNENQCHRFFYRKCLAQKRITHQSHIQSFRAVHFFLNGSGERTIQDQTAAEIIELRSGPISVQFVYNMLEHSPSNSLLNFQSVYNHTVQGSKYRVRHWPQYQSKGNYMLKIWMMMASVEMQSKIIIAPKFVNSGIMCLKTRAFRGTWLCCWVMNAKNQQKNCDKLKLKLHFFTLQGNNRKREFDVERSLYASTKPWYRLLAGGSFFCSDFLLVVSILLLLYGVNRFYYFDFLPIFRVPVRESLQPMHIRTHTRYTRAPTHFTCSAHAKDVHNIQLLRSLVIVVIVSFNRFHIVFFPINVAARRTRTHFFRSHNRNSL